MLVQRSGSMAAPLPNHLNNVSQNGEIPVNMTQNQDAYIYSLINIDPFFGVLCFNYRIIVNQLQSILSATRSRTGIVELRLLL